MDSLIADVLPGRRNAPGHPMVALQVGNRPRAEPSFENGPLLLGMKREPACRGDVGHPPTVCRGHVHPAAGLAQENGGENQP